MTAEGTPPARGAAAPKITLESRIAFRDLTVHREDGGDPLLGCKDVRRFLEIDEDTLEAIESVKRTRTLAEAEADLLARTDEEYDLVELVEYLHERGFVRRIDDQEIPPLVPLSAERHSLLNRVPPERIAWLHHWATWTALGALIAAWFVAASWVPEARPGYRDLFYLGRPSLILISSFALSLLITYGHELAHFFVARSYGIESTLSISHRFYMLVMITDVTNAWVLPRAAKLKIFLAGVVYNLTLMSLLGLTAAGILTGVLPLPLGLVAPLKFLAFLNTFPILFQFFFYARTDFYYALMVLMRERNLSKDALQFLKYTSLRAWRAVRGFPTEACGACGHRAQVEDPFCFRCGEARDVEDANRWPFRFAARRTLLVAGLIILLGQAWGYSKFFTVGVRAQMHFVKIGYKFLASSIADGRWWLIIEGELMFFITVLQALFVAWFLTSGLYGQIAPAVKRLLANVPRRREAPA